MGIVVVVTLTVYDAAAPVALSVAVIVAVPAPTDVTVRVLPATEVETTPVFEDCAVKPALGPPTFTLSV
jgi:hypothetical protein